MGGAKSSSSARSGGVVAPAVSLPEGTTIHSQSDRQTIYTSRMGPNLLAFYATKRPGAQGSYITYSFDVNYTYRRADLPPNERMDLARQTLKIARYDVSTRPEGTVFSVSAVGSDGYGPTRTRAYMAFGFSPPRFPGDDQYAIKRGGRLQPISEFEFFAEIGST